MNRSGTVIVLGAGASADAGYPLANDLFEPFQKAVEESNLKKIEMRKKQFDFLSQHGVKTEKIPEGGLTILEWFQKAWKKYLKAAKNMRPLDIPKLHPDGRPDTSSQVIRDTPTGSPALTSYGAFLEGKNHLPAYLESFFAFYDDYMRPGLYKEDRELGGLRTVQWRFRDLRKIAIETVYRELNAYHKPRADYLRPLFECAGPEKRGCVIASLNHDPVIEQIASKYGISIYDGFSSKQNYKIPLPEGWEEVETLKKRWEAVTEWYEFIGFQETPEEANLLLKLHGSLGWYVIEEGNGEIGYRDDLRHNVVYKYFRLPYETFWTPKNQENIIQLATGGTNDPVIQTNREQLT